MRRITDKQEVIPTGGLFRVASGRDHRLPCPEPQLSVQKEPYDRSFWKRQRFQPVARFAGPEIPPELTRVRPHPPCHPIVLKP
jgi:hypothetical protein